MDWPARSPDLNPIEHVWDFLGRRLAARTLPPKWLARLPKDPRKVTGNAILPEISMRLYKGQWSSEISQSSSESVCALSTIRQRDFICLRSC
ncbi:hypothetical protein TNCV_1625251 [Trichonephila clavipes]|nr:hypothetical protein TNCV_1625251 [Trichonephila clavipes]